MNSITLSCISYSVTKSQVTLKDWEEKLVKEITLLMRNGSKVIVYPEFFMLSLTDYFSGNLNDQMRMISNYTQEILLPRLSTELLGHDVLLVLGSGPMTRNDYIYNSCAIFQNDKWIFQDKIHLTPWETDFKAGHGLHVFNFHNLKTAILICFDIEQPSLALHLKEEGVDFVIVPTATTNKNGN